MGGVDCGDQKGLMQTGFKNVAHFVKWYKKAFLGLPDFSLLQGFTTCTLLVNILERPRQGGHKNVERDEKVVMLFNSIQGDDDIRG